MKTRLLITIMAVCVISAGPANAASDIEVIKAEYRTVPRSQVFDGTIEAVHETTVSAQTSGRIVEVLYDVDDFVEKGALLVRFEDTTQKAGLEKAKAGLVEAQARYSEARSEFDRIKGIYEQKLVSKSHYDQAEASFKAARAKLNASRAAKDEAQIRYDYTQVHAPYSGILTARHVEVGESATEGTPLMTGISLDFLRVLVNIPQNSINAVRTLKQAEVLVSDDAQPVPTEKITFFPYADPSTNTFRVRAYLPQAIEGLFPGMFVKVAFRVGEERQLLVPASAVVYRSEVTGLYIQYEDGSVALRQVRIGRKANGDQREVLAGLDEGEQVVLNPEQAIMRIKQGIKASSEEATDE